MDRFDISKIITEDCVQHEIFLSEYNTDDDKKYIVKKIKKFIQLNYDNKDKIKDFYLKVILFDLHRLFDLIYESDIKNMIKVFYLVQDNGCPNILDIVLSKKHLIDQNRIKILEKIFINSVKAGNIGMIEIFDKHNFVKKEYVDDLKEYTFMQNFLDN